MLFLGHAGIALGTAVVIAGALNSKAKVSRLTSLSRYFDIRFLLVGSLLPDIIDKPVGHYIFNETFGNGRIFSHTLLFLVLLTGIGFYLYKAHKQTWMLSIAAGNFIHLMLDGIWLIPTTLFWPLMGFQFGPKDTTGWLGGIFNGLFTDPSIYIPELIGVAAVLWFGIAVLKRKQAGALIKTGRVS